jgi:thiamine-phosphate pyrophosphorylase
VSESSVNGPGGFRGLGGRDLSQVIRGFYAILGRDDEALAERLVTPIERGGAGARVLQVRLKPASAREILAASRMARAVTRRHGAALVVNDRVDLAIAAEADGVHLGQDDLPITAARSVAGALWIGLSTHNDDQVRAAIAAGADYLGFGPVFATATKENPDPVQGLVGLARAVGLAGVIPIVAIGGITPDRAREIAASGAAAACAIGAVNAAVDPGAAGARIAAAWS